ncbi:MAG: helix-turn-helix domain-containing protein [Alistipes sp.]|jgi:signal transduction histidine kinase/DNA-binding response OmpR family regulator/streptogramin lyase|nr:helix-turn-helix domain-containing protein [Alistipes sp.]
MKRLSLLILCVVATQAASGYNLRQVSKYDGLSNSAIQTICQDSDGVMWFGSVDGLNMYDGRTLRTYSDTGGESLSGNLIENMIETEPSILWIQTNYGLDRFDKRRRTVERFGEYSSNYRLRKGGDVQLLFVRETDEIVYWNEVDNSFDHLPLDDFNYANLLDYLVTDDNILWLLMRDGESRAFSLVSDGNGRRTLVPYPTFEHPHQLRYAFHEGEAIYFVDLPGTLYRYDTWERKKTYIADIADEIEQWGDISSIVRDGDDYFVGFKTNGLICLRHISDSAQRYRTERIDGVGAGVFCLFRDPKQDIVWIGTDGHGVFIYSDDRYSIKPTVFEEFTHSVNKPVRAVLLDEENSLWIATKGDGLFRLRDYDFNRSVVQHRIDYFNTRNSPLSDNSVYSLSSSERGVMWIGTDSGVDWFDYASGGVRHLDVTIDGHPLRWVHGVESADDDTLWIATVGAGMVRVNLEWNGRTPRVVSVRRFMTGDGSISANYFFTVYDGCPGSVWFGNRGYGAYRHDVATGALDSLRFDAADASSTLNDIFCIMRGEEDEMWFGTSAGLVKRMPDGRITVYDKRSGFHGSTIHGMLMGSGGNIWLGTNFGIVRFNSSTETFVPYSRNAPTDVIEFSDGAFFGSRERGMLFFGGVNGFTAIRENEYAPVEYVPPIVFDRMTIFEQAHNIHDYLSESGEDGVPELRLGYRNNFFSLSLSAIDYIDGHNYTYKYLLDGMHDTWIDNGTSNTVYFTSIAPGRYALRMKALNPETGIETGEYTLGIHIRPPWYMSVVARVVYLFLVVVALFLLVRYLIRRNEVQRQRIIDGIREQHQKEVYESKLNFFTNIAHEFCTPLTLILGPCERILTHKGSNQFVRRYADLIKRNADRMNGLIQDLIEFRRTETGYKTPCIESVDVSRLVESVFDNFADLAESRGFAFSGDISPSVVWNSDSYFLITILNNLVSNAFKYTNSGGQISVALTIANEEMKLTVSNTGKGIRAENIERLFDRYSILNDFEYHAGTTDTRNGLGLAISYNLVRLLGGRIEVDSERGVETCFTVCLPAISPIDEKEASVGDQGGSDVPPPPSTSYPTETNDLRSAAEMPAHIVDESKSTVMVIDDERDMLWFVNDILAKEYNVIAVDNPSKVAEVLERMLPNVIVCDVMMPQTDGIAITKLLKTNIKTAHIPLILLSAKHHVDEQIEGLEAGADLYITKPFHINYLKASIRQLISRKNTLKEYFASPMSAYELSDGRLVHVAHHRFVQQMLDIITANLGNSRLSPQFIADKMNLSMRQLYRKIHEAGAESPMHMIRECRLHIALDLLQNTTMTVDEIIHNSGFSNRSSFFTAFSNKFGCTPREYRERHLESI